MKLILLSFFTILTLSQTLLGQEEHWIDKELDACLSIDSNQTTYGMNQCTFEGQQKWDKELNKYYKLLMNKLDANGKTSLKESQRQWIKYRDKEFEFIQYYYLQKQGTMWTNVVAGIKYHFIRNRALELKRIHERLDY